MAVGPLEGAEAPSDCFKKSCFQTAPPCPRGTFRRSYKRAFTAMKPHISKESTPSDGVQVLGDLTPDRSELLSEEARSLLLELERRFGPRRRDLLAARVARQQTLDEGQRPDFLAETHAVREADWQVAPTPKDLLDRRVEITGPVERKMVINALNSGSNVFMADFEDSCAPSWENVIDGQINLRDAVARTIEYTHPVTDKHYRLVDDPAVLFVRPRGLHLEEQHVLVDDRPVSASLFDFALYLFHNHAELARRGTSPYLYLPKLESHLEARWWNEVFVAAQDLLDIPTGTIRATVLIETILAAFEMDEILYELREHSVGLNCGRWDYIFSFIKKFRTDPDFILPDRALVGMDQHFLRSYSELLIQTCHRRGAHAMGGMAAQIPIKGDDARNAAAIAKVRVDKEREARAGHDGTWVAHPGLVAVALEEFDAVLTGPNQLHVLREDVQVTAEDLLRVPEGPITEEGLRQNLRVGTLYVEAWLRGVGCVPLYDLMEDAATAEISRTQVWQWVRHAARLADGRHLTPFLVSRILDEELQDERELVGEEAFATRPFQDAADLFSALIAADELEEFLTLSAYDILVAHTRAA